MHGSGHSVADGGECMLMVGGCRGRGGGGGPDVLLHG